MRAYLTQREAHGGPVPSVSIAVYPWFHLRSFGRAGYSSEVQRARETRPRTVK